MRKRKKWILWTLLLALCLGGCSSGTKVEESKVESGATEGETDPSQEETDPAGDFLEENDPKEEPKLLSLMTENKMDSVWEEGGQIVSTNYRKVWLEDREQGAVVGAGEFPELAEALRERNEKEEQAAKTFLEETNIQVQERMEMDENWQGEYTQEQDLWVIRADTSVLSILESEYAYTGGAHGFFAYSGVNLDSKTGQQLKLNEAVKDTGRLLEILTQRLPEKYPDVEFFGDWKKTIQEELEKELLTWTVGYGGMTFYFNPYELAPYAAGVQAITIPYKEEPELFSEKICQTPRSWATSIHPFLEYDLGQNNTSDTIEVGGEMDEYSTYTQFWISVNGAKKTMKDKWFYRYTPYLIHSEDLDGELLMVEEVSDNDFSTIFVYELNEEKSGFGEPWSFPDTGFYTYFEEWDEDTYIYGKEVFTNPSRFRLDTRINLLGTYSGTKWYSLHPSEKKNGYLFAEQDWYDVLHFDHFLTLLIPLEMEIPGTGETWEFPAGTKLWIVRTDGEYVEFATEDGRNCRVYVEQNEWPLRIRGVEEKDTTEIFDDMRYAG